MRVTCGLVPLLLCAAPADAATVALVDGRVHYVAVPGEVNTPEVSNTFVMDRAVQRITIHEASGLVAGAGCTFRDPQRVVCETEFSSVRLSLGDGDDRASVGADPDYPLVFPAGITADGGPGDDTLEGGMFHDELDGGPGHDTLRGGTGADVFTDSDADADAIEGGDDAYEFDRLDFSSRAAAVTVTGGRTGEGDRFSGIESLTLTAGADHFHAGATGLGVSGGAGDDELRGGDGDDTFSGGEGRDRLRGAGGADFLRPGPGADEVHCGRGADWALEPEARERLHGCERASFDLSNDFELTARLPAERAGRGRLRLDIGCPDDPADGESPASCRVPFVLSAGGRRVGHGTARGRPSTVRLNRRGRRLLRGGGWLTLSILLPERMLASTFYMRKTP